MLADTPDQPDRASAAGTDDTLHHDLSCIGCMYNLRGLSRQGTCPECGMAIRPSLYARSLAMGHPGWVQRMTLGIRLILAGPPGTLLAATLLPMGLYIGVGGGVALYALGVWLLHVPHPAVAETARPRRLSRLLLASLLALGSIPVLLVLVRMAPPTHELGLKTAIMLLIWLIIAIHIWCLGRHLAEHARIVNAWFAAQSLDINTRFAAVAGPALFLLSVIASMGHIWASLLAVAVAGLGLIGGIAFIAAMISLDRRYVRLQQQLRLMRMRKEPQTDSHR